MKLIVRGRGEGKTTAIVGAVREDPDGVLVCPNAMMARIIRETYNLRADQVVALPDLSHLRSSRGKRKNYYVDDLDLLINYILGSRPVLSSVTELEVV